MTESVSVETLVRALMWSAPSRRARVVQRLRVLAEAFDAPAARWGLRELLEWVQGFLAEPSRERVWVVLAVVAARLPVAEDVVDAARQARLDGGLAVVRAAISLPPGFRWIPALTRRDVEIVRDQVLVDVDHTSRVEFATGIQRVVRETVRRWVRDHDPILVGWTPDRSALRRLTPDEIDTTLTGTPHPAADRSRARVHRPPIDIVVPIGGTQLLPELSLEREPMMRLAALGEFSSTRVGVIGYDMVPLSSAETTNHLVSGGFANNLAAVKHADAVASISDATAHEYLGWKRMLSGGGIAGPSIRTVSLPTEPAAAARGDSEIASFSATYLHDDSPLVLVVGSHEPRKNHLAVLTAAERLWTRGHRFQLLFVGGNAWGSGYFLARLEDLRESSRPVHAISAMSDPDLWSAYRLARFSMFPSLTEGFGLPVVESLAAGTPALVSDYGSLREIGRDAGALLVDPRDDESILSGMESLLTDDLLVKELSDTARHRAITSWDDYAQSTWTSLVGP